MAATRPNIAEYDGTMDLATSIYPEIDASILAGPEFPYKVPQETSFKVPIAKMYSPTRAPILSLDTNIRFTSKYWYAPFETNTVRDHYGERFALSPVDCPKMFAGLHYSDKHALSPIEEIGHDYAEELALSPVNEKHRKSRGRKQYGVNKPENYYITVVARGRKRKHRIGEKPVGKSKRSRKTSSYEE
jgi:hypothetical protein